MTTLPEVSFRARPRSASASSHSRDSAPPVSSTDLGELPVLRQPLPRSNVRRIAGSPTLTFRSASANRSHSWACDASAA
jgi:hypothetical protein